WSTGTYLLWLPVKDSLPVKEIYAAAERLGIKRTWLCEYKDANLPPLPQSDRGDRKRMRSAALIIFNTPYLVPERAAEALAEMEPALGGKAVTRWLVPDTP